MMQEEAADAAHSIDTGNNNSSSGGIDGSRRAIVVGAGLVGCMTALFLSHQPHFRRLFPDGVDIYERRPDSRTETIERGRSINLAVSDRTFRTLRQLCGDELADRLLRELHENGIRMFGRYIHFAPSSSSPSSSTTSTTTTTTAGTGTQCRFMPYGRPEQYILSIDRRWLNEWLLSAAEERGVRAHFNSRCVRVKTHEQSSRVSVTFADETAPADDDDHHHHRHTVEGRLVLGCDGLNSVVRKQMQKNPRVRMDFAQRFISHGYRELKIPPTADGQFAMRSDSLHIWPRTQFMIIALPNPSKDFTVTLFAPYEGPNSFSELNTDEKVLEFFQREFPDALEHMGADNLLHYWHTNPICPLSHIKCNPFHHEDLVVLLGDAAHAVVPFYGQGVNCGFEDIRFLDSIVCRLVAKMDDMDDEAAVAESLKLALREYTATRKPSADAIYDLSEYNFHEMQASTASLLFHATRKIGILLHKLMPDSFIPLYSMVTFSPDISYEDAWNTHLRRERNVERVIKTFIGAAAGSLAYVAYRFALPKIGRFLDSSQTVGDVLSKVGLARK